MQYQRQLPPIDFTLSSRARNNTTKITHMAILSDYVGLQELQPLVKTSVNEAPMLQEDDKKAEFMFIVLSRLVA
jgi:hypothetical protein